MLLTGLIVVTSYTLETFHGWNLQVEASLPTDHAAEWQAVKDELGKQLHQIERVVPDGPLAKLRQVTIWIHWDDAGTPCMAYHPGAEWLKEHKMNPEMAKGVEIGSARRFISWTYEQPWMVMHELAHAYHDRFLEKGFENEEIKKAFKSAMDSKKYEAVMHWDGKTVKHYACTNPMEYFAEATEAYFGTNDFYPFVRPELQAFDPVGFDALKSVWGLPQKR